VRSPNRIVIAAAGGGKTTRIVEEVMVSPGARTAILTYTNNNIREIRSKFVELGHAQPTNVEIISWYSFLLRELARPYRNFKYDKRIDGIHWTETTVDRYAKKTDVGRYFFGNTSSIYSNKLAEFVCVCNQAGNGAVIKRLEQRFDRIYIDEIQDVAGYDIDVIELLLRSTIETVVVGDHRQSTFTTNNSNRHKGFLGLKIIDKFRDWERRKLANLEFQTISHRCHQTIANVADAFFPNEPSTQSTNEVTTDHDGVFAVTRAHVPAYIERFSPQILRLNVQTPCTGLSPLNFGDSKGMTFKRVLIFPHKKGRQWLETGDYEHVSGVRCRLYVGVTRARHSVAFVLDEECSVEGITRWQPDHATLE